MRYIGICLIIGALAGVLNGLFGAGGGLIVVPLLIHWLKLEEKKAFATSIAIILPLSVASFTIYALHSSDYWPTALPYLLGGILGGGLSMFLFRKISTAWLHRIFSLLILYGAVKAVLLL